MIAAGNSIPIEYPIRTKHDWYSPSSMESVSLMSPTTSRWRTVWSYSTTGSDTEVTVTVPTSFGAGE